jgi:RNA polymerase sigma factor (TIGR02999 family)
VSIPAFFSTLHMPNHPLSNCATAAPTEARAHRVASNAATVDASFSKVYDELRKLARRELRRGSKNTLYTTELVHEVYMKVCRNAALTFDNEVKFFKYAAIAMRHILMDRAVHRARLKAGGNDVHVDPSDPEFSLVGSSSSPHLALQLDAALRDLEEEYPRAAQVVELHYFAGLPLARVGELLGIARRTTDRDWSFARAYLESRL